MCYIIKASLWELMTMSDEYRTTKLCLDEGSDTWLSASSLSSPEATLIKLPPLKPGIWTHHRYSEVHGHRQCR